MKIETLAIHSASLTVYLRDAEEVMPMAQARPLVLVVPGGGYSHVSPREGDPVAVRFLAAGYHAAVLRYSVGEQAQNYLPLKQIDGALAALRAHADEWHILPDKIAACGFSAGAHLALSSAVLALPGQASWQERQRPNALILSYPVVTAGPFAHRGSFEALSGSAAVRPIWPATWRSAWRTRWAPTRRRCSSGTPWTTTPSRWKTACCSSRRCAAQACRAKRTWSPTGCMG